MTPFEKYLHAVIMRADHEAREDGSPTIEAQHLLLAVAGEQEPTTRELLASVGLDRAAVHAALEQEFAHSLSVVGVSSNAYDLPPASWRPVHPKMGTSGKLALERSMSLSRKKDMRPAHILLGILLAQAGTVPRALALAGVDLEDLTARTRQSLEN
jgi:ATP-dependent Clp protease ATP-binding subunit ClpA